MHEETHYEGDIVEMWKNRRVGLVYRILHVLSW
jgi:hypothetical protein